VSFPLATFFAAPLTSEVDTLSTASIKADADKTEPTTTKNKLVRHYPRKECFVKKDEKIILNANKSGSGN